MVKLKLKLRFTMLSWSAIFAVTAVSLVSGTSLDSGYMGMPTMGAMCPEGSTFCFAAGRCVVREPEAESPCILPEPVCDSNQVAQWTEYGYKTCVDFWAACGSDDHVCMVDGKLQCDFEQQCRYIEVAIVFSDPFDVLVVHGDTGGILLHLRDQISTQTGISINELWVPQVFPYGDVTYLTFRVNELHAVAIQTMIEAQALFLTALDGTPINILWETSWSKVHEPGTDHGSDDGGGSGTQCGQDQVFCFQSGKCLNPDGSCAVQHFECHDDKELCHNGYERYCAPAYGCEFSDVYLIIEVEFYSLVGSYYEHYEDTVNSIAEQIISWIPEDRSMIYGVLLHDAGGGMTGFYGKIPPSLYEMMLAVFDAKSGQLFDSLGSSQLIVWDRSGISPPHTGYDGSDGGDGSDGSSYDGTQCGVDQVFCFQSGRCVNRDGTCAAQTLECHDGEELCHDGYDRYCAPVGSCEFSDVYLVIEVEFYSLVGSYYEHYEDTVNSIAEQVILWIHEDRSMIYSVFLHDAGDGMTGFYGKIPSSLYEMMLAVFDAKSGQLIDSFGSSQFIVWDRCGISPPHTGHDGSDGGDGSDGSSYDGTQCGVDQVFCFQSGRCVNRDGTCAAQTLECHDGEELCHNGYDRYCASVGGCEFSDVYLVIGVEFYSLVGSYYEHYEDTVNSIAEQVILWIHADRSMIYSVFLHDAGDGRTGFYGKIAPSLYEMMLAVFDAKSGQLFDSLGSSQLIVWDASGISPPHTGSGDGSDGDGGDGSDHSSGGTQCGADQLFCFEKNQCVSPEGLCDHNECVLPKVYCLVAGEYECLEECPSVRLHIAIDMPFSQIASLDLAQIEGGIIMALSSSLGAAPEQIWNPVVFEDPDTGLIAVEVNISADFQPVLEALISSQSLDLSNMIPELSISIPIIWDKTYIDDGTGEPPAVDECSEGMMYCDLAEACMMLEECRDLKFEKNKLSSDDFLVKIPITVLDTSIDVFGADYTMVVNDLSAKITTTLTSSGIPCAVSNVVIQPRRIDSADILVYAQLNCISELATEDVNAFLQSMEFLDKFETEEGSVAVPIIVDAPTQIYGVRIPLAAGEEQMLTLDQLLPASDFDYVPETAILDCSETADVLVKSSETTDFSSSAPITKLGTFTIRHSLTVHQLFKCQIVTENTDEMSYFIGFMAIPMPMDLLGQIVHIDLHVSSLQLTEDSPWTHFPKDLFTIEMAGDDLKDTLEDWPSRMTDGNEYWISKDMPIQQVFAETANHLRDATISSLDTFRTTINVESDLSTPVAKFRYKGSPLTNKMQIPILLNPADVEIQVAADFSGSFNILIKENGDDSLQTFSLPVEVSDEPDRPVMIITREIYDGFDFFAYPYSNVGGDPTYRVEDIVTHAYEFPDATDVHGMVLLGSLNDDLTIDGTWEFSRDDGTTWESVNTIPVDAPMVLPGHRLQPEVLLRFTPSDPSMLWTLDYAPRIVFIAYDGSEGFDPTVVDIFIGLCRHIGSGVDTYCEKTGAMWYSESIVALPLSRYGCDGILNSGSTVLDCGCGDADSCLDCDGVANGGQTEDACAVCGGSNTEIDCTVAECATNMADYCALEGEEDEDTCEAGKVPNFYPACGEECMDAAFTATLDNCGVQCGTDACLDCQGTPSGNYVYDACGNCVDADSPSSDCNGFESISPKYAYYHDINHPIEIGITASYVVGITELQCTIISVDDPTLPEVDVRATSLSSDATRDYFALQLDATLSGSTDLIGTYHIDCFIADDIVITSQTNGLFLTVFGNPTLNSILPSESLVTDEEQYATVMGSGFVDTGIVNCVLNCEEIGWGSRCTHIGANGIWISETEVHCPVGELRWLKQARTYNIHVVLFDIYATMYDPTSLTSSVAYTLRHAAPVPISAELHKYGCKTIIVKFDKEVAVDVTDISDCSSFIDSPVFTDGECKMQIWGDNMLKIKFTNDIAAGTELIFKANKVRSAVDYNASPAYLTASVTITQDSLSATEMPIVSFVEEPTTVGCQGVVLIPKIVNKYCWDVDVTWSVSSSGNTDNIITDAKNLNQRVTQDMLDDGVNYIFTLSYKVGPLSALLLDDSISITLVKGSDVLPKLAIDGPQNADTTEMNMFTADLSFCGTPLAGVNIIWTLEPPIVSLRSGARTYIDANKLTPGRTYDLSAQVTTDSGSVTETLTFATDEIPIEPAISVNGNIVRRAEISTADDLELSCYDTAAGTNFDASDYTCIWSCKTNEYSTVETKMKPCMESDGSGWTTWREIGTTVTRPSLDSDTTTTTPDFVVRRRYKLVMIKSSQTVSTNALVKHIPPTVLEQPGLRIKSETEFIVDENTRRISLKVKCQKTTYYTWREADEDEEDIAHLDVENYIQRGSSDKDMEFSSKYRPCSITISFAGANLVSGQQYYLQLTAYNHLGSETRSESQKFYFSVAQTLEPGLINVLYSEPAIALTTDFEIVLTGWSDDVDLQCYTFYTFVSDTSGTFHYINTLSTSSRRGMPTFVLPEGEFNIRVECCKYTGSCALAQYGDAITVTQPASTDIMISITGSLPALIEYAVDVLIHVVREIASSYPAINADDYTTDEMNTALSIIKSSINEAITKTISNSFDDKSKYTSLRQSVGLARDFPTEVEKTTKDTMLQTVSGLLASATQLDVARRKKRSTTSESSASGLSEENALDLLSAFDVSLSEGTLAADEAETFRDAVGDIMVGMCQQFSGVTPWEAAAIRSYIKVYDTDMTGYSSTTYSVISGNADSQTDPVEIVFGADIASAFDDNWECTVYSNCTGVCLSTGLLDDDPYSAAAGVTAPTRKSDILVAKLINPETFATESVDSLSNPVTIKMLLNGTLDMDSYDYKCLMWISNDWADDVCTTTPPQLDSDTSKYYVDCSCTVLGIVAVFEEPQLGDETTTTSTTTTTTTTAPLPSVPIDPGTDYVEMTFTFVENFDDVVTSETTFINNLIQQLAAAFSYPTSIFRNMKVESGSVIVTFDVYNAGTGQSLGQVVYALQEGITSGNITLTSPNGTTLTLVPNSFSYTQKQGEEDSDEDSMNAGIIVGAVLGTIVVVVVVVLIILYFMKKKGFLKIGHSATSLPKDPPPRYEIPKLSFGMPAPPPYLYEDPAGSSANKWVENEMEMKEGLKPEAPIPRSSSSPRLMSAGLRSSAELHLQEKKPLPHVTN